MIKKTLKEIAFLVGGRVFGDEQVEISGIRGIDEALKGDLTFVANKKYQRKAASTQASAVLVPLTCRAVAKNMVVVADPYAALAILLNLYYPEDPPPERVGGASIEAEALVSPEAFIFPQAYIGKRAQIAKGAVIYPGVFIGNDVIIGEDTIIFPNVTVYRRSIIGRRVIIQAGAVIGSDGFGYANPGKDNLKIPQVGYVQIDDDVEIGANATVDRGTMGKTWIKKGVKIDNLVQVAHNVIIGENAIVVAQAGIAGSAKLGQGVIVGGQAGLVGHITIGDQVMVAAQAGVHRDVPAGQVVAGSPHLPHRAWLKKEAALARISEMRETMSLLKRKMSEIEDEVKKAKG